MKVNYRMSIAHLLCDTQEDKHTFIGHHGLPSPVSTYSDDDLTLRSPTSPSFSPYLSPSLKTRPTFYPMPVVMIARSRHHPQVTRRSSQTPTRMAWSPYEDELLSQGYEMGLSWAMISSTYLPHRSRGCCWGRFKTLQHKKLLSAHKQRHQRIKTKPWKVFDPEAMQ
ncbi:hypothetical protein DM01DRAFT_1335543 [Hesseltinella vesiculosa]|uniref:Myb-like domain-containing protein n=1 Tax=Hesseltinella vesiculosa TaxID=101127 RepID=A0A1X2GI80_9FUNG|nr:hypothetical protein DM01DRAFT_1335543 [Hesseltinella vesiculosa]